MVQSVVALIVSWRFASLSLPCFTKTRGWADRTCTHLIQFKPCRRLADHECRLRNSCLFMDMSSLTRAYWLSALPPVKSILRSPWGSWRPLWGHSRVHDKTADISFCICCQSSYDNRKENKEKQMRGLLNHCQDSDNSWWESYEISGIELEHTTCV